MYRYLADTMLISLTHTFLSVLFFFLLSTIDQDAAWVNRGTLKCSLPGEVLCLLKSSTFIAHDLNHA